MRSKYPGEWERTSLGAITAWSSGGTPAKSEPDFWGGNIPWFSAVSMKNYRLSDSDARVTELGLRNGSRLAPKRSVLLLVRGSELHKRIPLGITTKEVAFNQDVKALIAREPVYPEFVLYWLMANERMLLSKVEFTGIGAGKLDTALMQALSVALPSLPEQRAITHILGTLDDKIELNRRMNETLEGIARALFKSWFVDFDPVRAKAEGRQPVGMDSETAALFPDSFEESELGMIPKRWEFSTIGEFTNVLETGSRPRGGVKSILDGVPSIGAESIEGLGIFDFGKTKYVPLEYYQQMRRGHVQDRDVLIYKDGGKPGLLAPHVAMFGSGFPFDLMCINEHVFRFRSVEPLSQTYAFFWLSTPLLFDEMRMRATGVAQPGLNQEAVKAMPALVPPSAIVSAFDLLAEPLVSRVLSNSSESTALASLRDSLLPKLISGALRVPDAEKLMSESPP